MAYNKHYYIPGDQITEEERKQIRDFEEKKQQETEAFFSQISSKKELPAFMNAAFEPFEDRILLFPDPVEAKTKSGIIIPDEIQERMKPLTGTVVRVGPGKAGVKYQAEGAGIPLQEGERVYYGSYAGTPIDVNGIQYLIVRYADCFGRVR